MSEERKRQLSEALTIHRNALAACDALNAIDKDVLREIATKRIRWPIAIVGDRGRVSSGKKAEEYASEIELGAGLGINAGMPKSELKYWILRYIDWVYTIKDFPRPQRPSHEVPKEWAENGLDSEYIEFVDEDWRRCIDAFELPDLSDDSLGLWADHMSRVLERKAECEGDIEYEALIDGKSQRATVGGYPKEVEDLAVKNYRKMLARKKKRVETRARKKGDDGAIPGMQEFWKTYYVGQAEEKTELINYEGSSLREKVGEILKTLVGGTSPKKNQ